LLIVQVYVDNIIYGSTNENMCKEFTDHIQNEFEISMIVEVRFIIFLACKSSNTLIEFSLVKKNMSA